MRYLKYFKAVIAVLFMVSGTAISVASEFTQPWRNNSRALIIDGYEHNEIDLVQMSKDKRIAAFIHKGSDGLPAKYRCTGNTTEVKLCKQTWRRYIIARELYHTRRALAKALGMKWGAYHLARPGNPLDQARHFLDYTDPSDDEAIVIDLEDNDSEKWMSLEDAEKFARYIHRRLGRWPMLYTNGSTAQHIAHYKDKYKILSRLPLWYARYKPSIASHFPKGHWDTYGIWQFQAQINCNKRRCPYRVKGANLDIDVNVVDMSVAELKAAWPLDDLIAVQDPKPELLLASLPVPRPVRETSGAAIMAAYTDAKRFAHSKEPPQPVILATKSRPTKAITTKKTLLAAYTTLSVTRDRVLIERELAAEKMVETVFYVIEDTVIKPSMVKLASAHVHAAHVRRTPVSDVGIDPINTSYVGPAR